MSLRNLASLAFAAVGLAACSAETTTPDEPTVEATPPETPVGGTDRVSPGESSSAEAPAAAPGALRPQRVASACTTSQATIAQDHCEANHAQGFCAYCNISSCNYNPDSGYVVYTYSVGYEVSPLCMLLF